MLDHALSVASGIHQIVHGSRANSTQLSPDPVAAPPAPAVTNRDQRQCKRSEVGIGECTRHVVDYRHTWLRWQRQGGEEVAMANN
jgi:hypothetical protein